ncbi:MAG TPA: hypothetical protein P5250_02820 [Bacteroidales bacterium]|nr:hypothetical protein [Bacteroidales bacterium]
MKKLTFILILVTSLCLKINFLFSQNIPSIIINGNVVPANDDLKLPFWLNEGNNLAIDQYVKYISAIEYKIINNSVLEFSQVKLITTSETVPAGYTWKIESIIKTFEAVSNNNPIPTMISNESSTDMTYANAVTYCRNLTEQGYSDWRMPNLEEMKLFIGYSNSNKQLWTSTLYKQDFFVNNYAYMTIRLDSGIIYNGGIDTRILLAIPASGTYNSTSWTTVASFGGTGKALILNRFKMWGYTGSYGTTRFIINYNDGTSYTSNEYTNSTAPYLLEDMTFTGQTYPITKYISRIDLQGKCSSASYTVNGMISGYEVTTGHTAATKFYTRCVR